MVLYVHKPQNLLSQARIRIDEYATGSLNSWLDWFLIGFLLFLHLTVHLAMSPPMPQALDSIWQSAHSLNVQIEEGVHSLQLLVENFEVALHHSLASQRRLV